MKVTKSRIQLNSAINSKTTLIKIPFYNSKISGAYNEILIQDETTIKFNMNISTENIDATFNAIDRAELTQVSDSDFKRIMMKKQMMSQRNTAPQLDGADVDFSMTKKRKMMKKARQMEKQKKRERRRQMKEKKRRMMEEKRRDSVGERVDCMITEWTEWEKCTETCGKQYVTRTRMVKRQPENGGKRCPKKLLRKRKCKLPKCRK